MTSTASRGSGRRIIVIATVAMLALAVLYTAYWLLLAVYVRAAAETWIESRRNEGYAVAYDDVDVGGYPGAVRLSFERPHVTVPPREGAGSWAAARFDAAINPFDWTRQTYEVFGDHIVTLGEPPRQDVLHGRAEVFTIDADLGGAVPDGVLTVRNWTLREEGGEQVTIERLDASGRVVAGEQGAATGPAYALDAAAARVLLPAHANSPLGREIQSVSFDSTVIGPFDFRRWPAGLLRWRDAGGVWEIERLAAVYGPVSLTGDGTVALDTAGQPEGALTLQVQGLLDAVDAFQAHGLIGPKEALGVKFLWSALARPPQGGGAPVITVPMTVQDRFLAVGPLRLVRLPEIEWR